MLCHQNTGDKAKRPNSLLQQFLFLREKIYWTKQPTPCGADFFIPIASRRAQDVAVSKT
jgi:hypothetical protein